MKKIIIILAIVALSAPVHACGKWVLEGSQITGSKYSSGLVNLCYYQDLEGSGQVLKMRLPASRNCPIILDPCPEGGSRTEVTVNQQQTNDLSEAEMLRQFQEDYPEWVNGHK